MTRRETAEQATGADVTGCFGSEEQAVPCAANSLPKELYAQRPSFDAPRASNRWLQSWASCRRCSLWYAAPTKELNRGRRVYCSIRCTAAHAAATGKFRGEKNPRWQGGVSNDNMRYRRRQKEREPVKEAARAAVYNALKRGDLVRRPCEKCGLEKSEGHHDDYSKPLEVRWLCRTHHVEHHQSLKDAA